MGETRLVMGRLYLDLLILLLSRRDNGTIYLYDSCHHYIPKLADTSPRTATTWFSIAPSYACREDASSRRKRLGKA